MATKGYHQYRGRGRGGKTLLVLLLLLILLGACAFLFLQRYIVYHDDGTVSIELPFDFSRPQEDPTPIPPEDVDVEREDPEDTPPPADDPEPLVLSPLHAQELTYGCLYSDPTWQLQGQEAVVVNVKRQDGTIAYYTDISLPDNVLRGNEATRTHLQTIAQSPCYTVARMSVMCDSAYAAAVPSAAISYTYGGLWVDNYNRFWLDPTNEQVIAHICALAKECVDLGFDEILLDHLRYPIEGSLSQYVQQPAEDGPDHRQRRYGSRRRHRQPGKSGPGGRRRQGGCQHHSARQHRHRLFLCPERPDRAGPERVL